MNPEAQAELDRILTKEERELTEHDKAFLRARLPYIGKHSRQKFASVFTEQPAAPVEPTKEAGTPPAPFPPTPAPVDQEDEEEVETQPDDEVEE